MVEHAPNTDDDRQQFEVGELLTLARDKSIDGRTRLVQIVGDLFFDAERVLNDRERSHMTEILRQLIHDVEKSVRRAVADRLAAEANAPSDLIVALANDEIQVAYPILTESAVLQDIELIEVISHRSQKHQLAISIRESLSETISGALVETGDTDVIKSLLENASAAISHKTMEYLVEESQRVDAYRNPLVHRHDLNPALAKRLYWWVSAALRSHILETYRIDPTELEETIEGAVVDLMTEEKVDDPAKRQSAELAQQIEAAGKITPGLLIQTLRQGEITLFEDLFARLTGLDTVVVRRSIFEPGGEGLAIACKAVSIEKPDFASIFLLSRSARPGDKVVDPSELSAVISLFDRMRPYSAIKVLRRWRLDPNFLFALKQLEPRSKKRPQTG